MILMLDNDLSVSIKRLKQPNLLTDVLLERVAIWQQFIDLGRCLGMNIHRKGKNVVALCV